MKIHQKFRIGLLAVGLALSAFQCDERDEDKSPGGTGGWYWLQMARSIDRQLGDVSDGTVNTCGGNDLAIIGDHCKNQLLGTMDPEMIRELVRIAVDYWDPSDLAGLGDRNLLFRRGFRPQTADPCGEDLDADGVPDYKNTCAANNQVLCVGAGANNYVIEYIDCVFDDSGTNWILDGTVGIKTLLGARNELLVLGATRGYRETEQATNRSYVVSGDIVRYQIISPVTGAPALGSQGAYPDGMEIVSVNVMSDPDGDGTDDVGPYSFSFINDFEDGLAFVTATGQVVYVWIDYAAPNLVLDFTDRRLPRNGNELGAEPGCQVMIDLGAVDPVNRLFDYTSVGGCLGNQTDVSY